MMIDKHDWNRRDFIKIVGAAAATLATVGCSSPSATQTPNTDPLADDAMADDAQRNAHEGASPKNPEVPRIPCTSCRHCMPCPYAIDIPGIFIYYNKCLDEGHYTKSIQEPNYLEARRAFLIGYDRAVLRPRQAIHCIGCGKCVPRCPHHIDIPAEMTRISRYVEFLKRNPEAEDPV